MISTRATYSVESLHYLASSCNAQNFDITSFNFFIIFLFFIIIINKATDLTARVIHTVYTRTIVISYNVLRRGSAGLCIVPRPHSHAVLRLTAFAAGSRRTSDPGDKYLNGFPYDCIYSPSAYGIRKVQFDKIPLTIITHQYTPAPLLFSLTLANIWLTCLFR